MPKGTGLKPRLAHAEESFIREPAVALTLEDRTALRTFFASSPFKRAWANAKLNEPPVPLADLSGPLGEKIANNRIHEMRGWKLFEAALLKQLNDPAPIVRRAQETWPDAGVNIVDPDKLPKPKPAQP